MAKRKLDTTDAIQPNTSTAWMSASTVIPKEQLVIAKAKVEACEQFLVSAARSPHSLHIMVLQGPSCSGKTALIRSVCAHLKLVVVQVDELIDADHNGDGDHASGHSSGHAREMVMQKVMQNSKFPALPLFSAQGRQLANSGRQGKVTFIDDIDSMPDASQAHLCRTLKRLTSGVYVLSCADWFAVCKWCRGFRELVVFELQLNQMAVTFLQRAIRQWGFDPDLVPKELLDGGDLRSCLHHAYLMQLARGGGGGLDSLREMDSLQCDQKLTFFHALGRLFYPLKCRQEMWCPFTPDDRQSFLLYIHHNMFPFMASLDEAATVLEALSVDGQFDSVPWVEFVLTVLVNREGRVGNRVRPAFTRPDLRAFAQIY